MSLSRSPSPAPGGGWSSPGLTPQHPHSGHSSPRFGMGTNGGNAISWAAAKSHSERVKAYPSFETRNDGFFSRSKRKISASLPRFSIAPRGFREKEKLGRGRWHGFGSSDSMAGRIRTFLGASLRRKRVLLLLLSLTLFVLWAFLANSLTQAYRRSPMGNGSKIVVILGSNVGGGVLDVKGAREWAMERESVENKKKYTQRWGYDLDIVDMATKKRYAHEWRESWEKVDKIRQSMRKYPNAEWFWWLDLNTIIMEPSYSLESHIFNRLSEITYRDINHFNPLNIPHPPSANFLDPVSLSPTGDNSTSSIDLLIPQDCDGFNIGSFFVRRSQWTDQLLDFWWDPVAYEQMHLVWNHNEQDSLEYVYTNQPWIRSHVAFVPARKINALPPGTCTSKGDNHSMIHYNQDDRDFLVNMAGCEWGRDCWGEISEYSSLSDRLNRNRWQKIKDGVFQWWFGTEPRGPVTTMDEAGK